MTEHLIDSPLTAVVRAQKAGLARGITSVCSAHPLVLEASFAHAASHGSPLLIESTCNQVNQFGGYTGQTPAAFMAAIGRLAKGHELAPEQLIMGGDHLGPYPWQSAAAAVALGNAADMVDAYVRAGYTKIHLDASMRCADDPAGPLPVAVIAARSADLAFAAERAALASDEPQRLRYVIGSEVPLPGGAFGAEESEDAHLSVTAVADVAETITVTRAAFMERGLEDAWERVIAVVVQPGVEFDDATLFPYDRARAQGLSRAIEPFDTLVYEAHSTDYQTPVALSDLVADHFAILKVGPALTFAMREAIFALAQIEEVLPVRSLAGAPSRLRETIEQAMIADSRYWQTHYTGTPAEQRLARGYSYSDRIRYYWGVPVVTQALDRLLGNFTAGTIPEPLLSQFMPAQYHAIREGRLPRDPRELVLYAITAVLEAYATACGS